MTKDKTRDMTVCEMSDSAHPETLLAADVYNCSGCGIETYYSMLTPYMTKAHEQFDDEYEKLRTSKTQELVEVYGA
jgi:hypothetical protein